VNNRQCATLAAVFEDPLRTDIGWGDIRSLLAALGGVISEGRGSRVRVTLGDRKAVFHRPHPRNETDRGTVRSVRTFLIEAGVAP
jgi:hypothetical protein